MIPELKDRTAIDFGRLSNLKVTSKFDDESHRVECSFSFAVDGATPERISELMGMYKRLLPLNVIIYTQQKEFPFGNPEADSGSSTNEPLPPDSGQGPEDGCRPDKPQVDPETGEILTDGPAIVTE